MYTYGYLFYIPVTTIFLFFSLFTGIRKRRTLGYYLVSCITCVYVNQMIDYAFFPIRTNSSVSITHIWSFINLRLDIQNWDTYQIVGNLLLTFPIGFLVPFAVHVTKKQSYKLTLLLSISIEFIQLVMIALLHIATKCFDIQDIFLNAIGGLAGCICFSLISRLIYILFKSLLPTKLKGHDLLSFILIVCCNYTAGQGTFTNLQKES